MKVKTWDGNSINDGTYYQCVLRESFYGLPVVKVGGAGRNGRWPVLTGIERSGRVLELDVYIKTTTSLSTLQNQLLRWFDPETEVSKKLVCEDDAGGGDRYVMGICQALEEAPRSAGMHYHAMIVVDGDVRWRKVTASSSTWTITATGGTKTITNSGTDEAYPVLTITPTAAKSTGYGYKRFVPVKWLASAGYINYPVDICNDGFDTATLIGASKMQADGDDLRVFVDGAEKDRWLDGINTSTTKVWINLSFQAAQDATLKTAIAASGAITTIEVNESIVDFPASGILLCGSEVFTYTGKSDTSKRFTGVTRAAKGTSEAAHAISATVDWIQYDVWILYGNASSTAPVTDDNYKPAFALASSTNTSWDYDTFGPGGTGAWSRASAGSGITYTADKDSDAVPWSEIGVRCINATYPSGEYWIYNPCGITVANFANGEYFANLIAMSNGSYFGQIMSALSSGSYVQEYLIGGPSSNDVWESWSRNETLISGSVYVKMRLEAATNLGTGDMSLECADVTLTLNSSYTPVIAIGTEQGNYSLACKITNNTTVNAIELSYTMAVNQDLEVDTDLKTITLLDDGSNQFQALTVTAGPRRNWLPLAVGANTLKYDDTGCDTVTVVIDWEERHYQ